MFVRGGNVWPGLGLNYAGGPGNYWSSVGHDSSRAYTLYFYSGGVDPSYRFSWYFGQPIRCVALGSRIRFVAKTT